MYSTDIYTIYYYWHTLYGIIFIYQTHTHTHTQLMMYNNDVKIMFLIKCRMNHEITLRQFFNVLSQSTNKHQKAWLEILHSLHTSFKTKEAKPRFAFKNKYFVSFTGCFLFIQSRRLTTGSTFIETQFP